MSHFKTPLLLLVAFFGGFLLHAWSPWPTTRPFPRQSPPLQAFNYDKSGHDALLESKAAEFIAKLDTNYPATATESLLAIVMLHERYGEPYLAGYQISSYASRYMEAQAILTAHLIKDSTDEHRERVIRLRRTLGILNEADIDYGCSTSPGSGCVRDRMTDFMPVEDMVSRWALRLSSHSYGSNSDPRRSFRKIYDNLANDQARLVQFLRDNNDDNEPLLERAAMTRPAIVAALDKVCEELKGWPPEVAEDLALLVLIADFNN